MILSLLQILMLIGGGVLLAILGVMVGGWIAFKSSRAVPGEKFVGGVPKGQAFTLADEIDKMDEPDQHEKTVLERTEKFLKALGGQG